MEYENNPLPNNPSDFVAYCVNAMKECIALQAEIKDRSAPSPPNSEAFIYVKEVPQPFSEIVAIYVEAMKASIMLSDGSDDSDLFPDQIRETIQTLGRMLILIVSACHMVEKSEKFRLAWTIEAEKYGVPPSQDPTTLVLSLLYKLADGNVCSDHDLESWIGMIKTFAKLQKKPSRPTS